MLQPSLFFVIFAPNKKRFNEIGLLHVVLGFNPLRSLAW